MFKTSMSEYQIKNPPSLVCSCCKYLPTTFSQL